MAPIVATVNQHVHCSLQRIVDVAKLTPRAGSTSARKASFKCSASSESASSERQGNAARIQPDHLIFPAAEDAGGIVMNISTHYQGAQAEFGEQLKLVGSCPELGDWVVDQAPEMHWTDGHVWVTSVTVPQGSEVDFKVVHVAHHGVIWEPGVNKSLRTDAAAGPPLDVTMAWGFPELTKWKPRADDAQDVFSTAQAPEWNPPQREIGLPEHITEVPHEPLNAVLAEEEVEASKQEVDTHNPLGTTVGDTVAGYEDEAPQLLKKRARSGKSDNEKSGRKTTGQAAGYAAAGIVTAVVLSALAVDITDAAIVSAIVAAGAALLPGTNDSKSGERRAVEGQGAASPFFGAVELGLKASLLASFLNKNKENSSVTAFNTAENDMTSLIAGKVAEACAFAESYNPTEEELFEMTAPYCRMVDAPSLANNVLPTDGKLSKLPVRMQ